MRGFVESDAILAGITVTDKGLATIPLITRACYLLSAEQGCFYLFMLALIRHGAHQVFPDHLTEQGRKDVYLLAKRLQKIGTWASILSSPRPRTRETAEIIAEVLGISVRLDDSLLETANHEQWMPSCTTLSGMILVTHLPVIREIGGAWVKSFWMSGLPAVGVGEGVVVDVVARVVARV